MFPKQKMLHTSIKMYRPINNRRLCPILGIYTAMYKLKYMKIFSTPSFKTPPCCLCLIGSIIAPFHNKSQPLAYAPPWKLCESQVSGSHRAHLTNHPHSPSPASGQISAVTRRRNPDSTPFANSPGLAFIYYSPPLFFSMGPERVVGHGC